MSLTQGVSLLLTAHSAIPTVHNPSRTSNAFPSFQIQNNLGFESYSHANYGQGNETPENFTGCANKICKNHTQSTKQQPIEISPQTLCYRCKEQFLKDEFCIYCKQIYFDQTDDGKEWIMCDQCGRWVHTQCADFNTKQNVNVVFQCIKCRKIESVPNGRRNIQRGGQGKTEKKKNSQFLTSLGFDWELKNSEISEDMENIRKYLG